MTKRIALIAFALITALAITGCTQKATAQDSGRVVVELGENLQAQNKLAVQGAGTIKVMPDVAYVTIGVTTNEQEAAAAQEQNRQLMNAIFEALKAEGLTEDDMRTTSYTTYPIYKYDSANEIVSYEVKNMVELTIKDLNNVGKIIDTAGANGANTAYSVRFSLLDKSIPYNEALKMAMENARQKADALISVSGNEIIGTLNISENSYGYVSYDNFSREMAAADTNAPTPITAGELEVTANITVVYEIK